VTGRDLQKFRAYLRKSVGEGSTTTYTRVVELALTRFPDDPMKLMLQRHLSNATRHTYQAALRHWADFSGDKALGERLRSKELRRDLKDRRRAEHVERNRHIVRPFSPDEERRIYTTLQRWREDADRPVWQWPAVSMMFMLGLRAGVDLAYLARKDVEAALRSGVELIIVTKGSKERTVPAVLVLDELQTLLDVEQHWEILADLIVSDRAPDSPRKVANAYEHLRLCVKKLAEEVGIPSNEMHPHRFRHSAANRLYEATKDVKKVQEFLGHESLNTTLGYLKKDRTEAIGQDLLAAMKGLRGE
jgi:integrase